MTETTETTDREREIAARRLRGIRETHSWFGMFTIENAEAVRDRIRLMLDGHRYTFVAYDTDFGRNSIDVRTGQRLDPKGTRNNDALSLSTDPLSDGTPWAHLFAHDTYGVWGISTTHPTEGDAYTDQHDGKKNWTYLHFEGFGDQGTGKITIEQFNGYGHLLRWVITTEYVSSYERAAQEAATLAAARKLLAAGWQRPESPYSYEKGKERPAFGPAPRLALDALDDMAAYVLEHERPITGKEG